MYSYVHTRWILRKRIRWWILGPSEIVSLQCCGDFGAVVSWWCGRINIQLYKTMSYSETEPTSLKRKRIKWHHFNKWIGSKEGWSCIKALNERMRMESWTEVNRTNRIKKLSWHRDKGDLLKLINRDRIIRFGELFLSKNFRRYF